MSYSHNTRKRREWVGTQNTSGAGSAINKKSALSAAYAELGKELTSGKLRSIGTYTLGRPIGEGTYGKVRLGTHRLTGVRVAIKQVPKAHCSTLTREIHHHRRLHHPNLMQLYEVLASESYIWMVTELCAGGELYDYLVERGTMPEPEARRIFGQLCMAVAYIHDRGIVHRDLKLENVLLDERCNVKLGDFGFTREFEGKKLMETFCGTTGYAAPEMLAGRRYTGEEVDVWSLGIILYALVCGALPFDDDDDGVMKDKILKGEFELPDVLSEECLDLITRILQQEPTARPTIKDILRHPWFTKTMAPTQMETVNEDELNEKPLESVAETSTSDNRFLAAKSDLLASSPGEIDLDRSKNAEQETKEDLSHKISSSGLSETSFFSAQSKSDSESSDKQSNHTQTTGPTSDGGDEEARVARRLAEEMKPPLAPLSLKHRNESQTTIKRQASASSDASRIATGTSSKSNSIPLPTHSESSEAGGISTEDAFTPLMAFSSPLEKRPSQSSSRGPHHRTPSRTKRRSSGGLSDHHPPSLDLKPIDYLALLEISTPAIFSTVLEQNLLHQLSGLGMDVGQIVHSVVNEACDASGAMWWILKKKAEEKLQQEHDQGLSPYMATYTLAHAPATNTAPLNEQGRLRNDSNISDYRPADKSTAAKTSPLVSHRDLVRPTAIKPEIGQVPLHKAPQDAQQSEIIRSKAFDIPQRQSSNLVSDGPLSDTTHGPVSSQYTNAAMRQNTPSQQRNRASSFSARLTQVLAGKDKELRNENGEPSIMIGNEQIPMEERAKSPVMPGFFSKKSERNSPSPASTPKGDKKKDAKSPLRPETSPSVSAQVKSESKRSGSREEKREQSSPTDPPIRKGKGKAENLTNKSDLKATKSFETFSTVSSNSHTDGTNDGSATKSKGPKSSFLHTVRNWLGTEDKSGNNSNSRIGTTKKKKKRQQQQQQQQQLQLSTKASSTMSHRQAHSPVNVKRLSSTQGLRPASPAMVRNGSLRRQPPVAYSSASVARSPRLSQRGSISRRSSSGSVQYATITQRPLNPRRPSAGSITPTTVGPGVEDFLVPIRHSRPSSAQSHTRPLGSLHAKSGSTGSSNSFARMQSHGSGYSGSLRGIHARRPSVDGGTTVRRHRHYPHHTRSDSLSHSRPSTPNRNSIIEDLSMDTVTPRRSLDFDVGRSSPLHTPRASQSVFVAHRSRTPYKPPSANPSLLHHEDRDQGNNSQNFAHGRFFYHGVQPPTAFGTWRRSWGKPPPSWSGPVDLQSPSDEKKSDGTSTINHDQDEGSAKPLSLKPALRDVFANRESDDDWEDEDDEPTYAGGLGQLASSSWAHDSSGSGMNSFGQQPSTPISKRSEGMPNNLLSSGRYAGVRNIFQAPSLGREVMPRAWIMSGNEGDEKENEKGTNSKQTVDINTTKDGIPPSSPIRRPINLMSTNAINTSNPTTNTSTSSATTIPEANKDSNIATTSLSNNNTTTSRVRSAAPTFKGPVTIEEEEEDE